LKSEFYPFTSSSVPATLNMALSEIFDGGMPIEGAGALVRPGATLVRDAKTSRLPQSWLRLKQCPRTKAQLGVPLCCFRRLLRSFGAYDTCLRRLGFRRCCLLLNLYRLALCLGRLAPCFDLPIIYFDLCSHRLRVASSGSSAISISPARAKIRHSAFGCQWARRTALRP
jgi:hypothetical protein